MRLPLVEHAVSRGASQATYVAFLTEAYHHVKHTFPLLALSASITKDGMLRAALAEYMKEEFGHENWILEDIQRMGGDAAAVAASKPQFACRVMIAHVYYSVQWESPYAVLGMVHVLEGLSVLLADKLARALKQRFGSSSDDGFSYLRTHGALDVEHTEMFERLMNDLKDPAVVDLVIEHTRMMYRLYGAIFEDLAALELPRAA
jgi:pyrroloquinoline quinone (PQQ) biosynthesis protein C